MMGLRGDPPAGEVRQARLCRGQSLGDSSAGGPLDRVDQPVPPQGMVEAGHSVRALADVSPEARVQLGYALGRRGQVARDQMEESVGKGDVGLRPGIAAAAPQPHVESLEVAVDARRGQDQIAVGSVDPPRAARSMVIFRRASHPAWPGTLCAFRLVAQWRDEGQGLSGYLPVGQVA